MLRTPDPSMPTHSSPPWRFCESELRDEGRNDEDADKVDKPSLSGGDSTTALAYHKPVSCDSNTEKCAVLRLVQTLTKVKNSIQANTSQSEESEDYPTRIEATGLITSPANYARGSYDLWPQSSNTIIDSSSIAAAPNSPMAMTRISRKLCAPRSTVSESQWQTANLTSHSLPGLEKVTLSEPIIL